MISCIKIYILVRAEEMQRINTSGLSTKEHTVEKLIGWQPPFWPWCKLNKDGACNAMEMPVLVRLFVTSTENGLVASR